MAGCQLSLYQGVGIEKVVRIKAGDRIVDYDSYIPQWIPPVLNTCDEMCECDSRSLSFAKVLRHNVTPDNLEMLIVRHYDPQIVLTEVRTEQLVNPLRSFRGFKELPFKRANLIV